MVKAQVNQDLSLRKRCSLLQVNRSSLYIVKQGSESSLNIELMDHIDRMYLDHPE